MKAFETFADKDFSHRRLAHRGSYNGLFWASASTVRRVLNDHEAYSWGVGEYESEDGCDGFWEGV